MVTIINIIISMTTDITSNQIHKLEIGHLSTSEHTETLCAQIKINYLLNNRIEEINKLLYNSQNIINDKNIINMSNLPNIINSLSIIRNNDLIIDVNNNNINNNSINDDVISYQVDIKTIIANAKSDKRFYKLLNLCIKYDIHLFNQYNDLSTLVKIENLLSQCDKKQTELTKQLSEKIMDISNTGPSVSWLVDIENINTQFKKKFKEIEIIIYILKNIYDDEILKKLCCIEIINKNNNSTKTDSNTSPSQSSSNNNGLNNGPTNNELNNNEQNNNSSVGTTSKSKSSTNKSTTSKSKSTTSKSTTSKSKIDKIDKISKYIAIYSN